MNKLLIFGTSINRKPMGKFINPFSDWGFKQIFGQEVSKELLISFLNDLLKGEHHIEDLSFKDKELLSDRWEERGIIYDIYCTTDKGEHIIVEMQNRYQENFLDRSLYYVARNIAKQGEKGKWNYKLVAVYGVYFMNFTTSDIRSGKFRTDMVIADRETHQVSIDKMRLIYLMLPLFNKEEEECTNDFERWIYILKNMDTFERMPFMARNAIFKKLAEIADIHALSKEDREKYDESIKVMRDNMAVYNGAISEGHEKGLQEGRKEGREEEKREIARKLKALGIPSDKIVESTGLSASDIERL